MKVSPEQIHQIRAYLTKHGLTIAEVHTNVLDHSGYMTTCLLLLGSFLQNHPIMLPGLLYYYGVPILNIIGIVILCFAFLPSLFLYAYQRSLEKVKQ